MNRNVNKAEKLSKWVSLILLSIGVALLTVSIIIGNIEIIKTPIFTGKENFTNNSAKMLVLFGDIFFVLLCIYLIGVIKHFATNDKP